MVPCLAWYSFFVRLVSIFYLVGGGGRVLESSLNTAMSLLMAPVVAMLEPGMAKNSTVSATSNDTRNTTVLLQSPDSVLVLPSSVARSEDRCIQMAGGEEVRSDSSKAPHHQRCTWHELCADNVHYWCRHVVATENSILVVFCVHASRFMAEKVSKAPPHADMSIST